MAEKDGITGKPLERARLRERAAFRAGDLCVVPTEDIKRMVVDGHSAIEIRSKALEEGMITLRRAALNNAKRGNTSISEVLRVTLADNRPGYQRKVEEEVAE